MVKKRNKKKIILISVVSFLLSIPLVILPILSIVVYESIFGTRYETVSWMRFSVEDYDGLEMKRSDFQSGDVTLAGYKYSASKCPPIDFAVLWGILHDCKYTHSPANGIRSPAIRCFTKELH